MIAAGRRTHASSGASARRCHHDDGFDSLDHHHCTAGNDDHVGAPALDVEWVYAGAQTRCGARNGRSGRRNHRLSACQGGRSCYSSPPPRRV